MKSDTHKEGKVAKAIEEQTAKIPSDLFLWGAFGAVLLSAGLQAIGKKEQSNFVGQWVPTILILGVYNKLVKVAGSDKTESKSEDTGFGTQEGRVSVAS